ncbi:MAG: DUF5069 domain-containing protein [Nitrospina sp.]|jgi:hypothetical protein|nr:DUF5069 domain-containing protein [Nitrospina sp.]MBT3414389.1 DUF5069 domain-containing protein [Nitrospina sp.]MBT3858141.1 DUF5069 domain-containing protein [Nitrospina sp.]MBT4049521.1 DUF5069 domain-containing protein [Nitrospina sp.]MBT4389108.1 DUF5069 domain-containing protein [Nitrospina sp.]
MDLSRAYPRSPKEEMAGLVHLARMIDKAQAFKQGQMADYIYPSPLDKIILNFLRIDSDVFAAKAMESSDEEIRTWAEETLKGKKPEELEFINDQILKRRPDSEDRLKYFYQTRDRIDPSRADVETWVDLLDLEEGRLPKK